MRTQSFRSTLLLGIDGLQLTLEATARGGSADNYPPYNLERIPGTDNLGGLLRLIFAVAGFAPEQLEISLAGDQLSISGEQNGDTDPQRYLYRGIASRRFRRVFLLAEQLGVERATLVNGLLSIDLRERGRDRESRTIEIGGRDT